MSAPVLDDAQLSDLPEPVRQLVAAVDDIRGQLPLGLDERLTQLWELVLAAQDAVYDLDVPAGPEPAPVVPPMPGVAVLMCRCGEMLDARDMRRPIRPAAGESGAVVAPIVCRTCAVIG